MNIPRIESRWGNGFDNLAIRNKFRPLARTALERMMESIEEEQLIWTSPKRMVLDLRNNEKGWCGISQLSTAHILLRTSCLQYPVASALKTSSIELHEAVHLFRNETSENDTWFETAATEGLAYVAQARHTRRVHKEVGFKIPKFSSAAYVARANEMPKRELRKMRDEFLEAYMGQEDNYLEAVDKKWTQRSMPYYGLSRAEVIGICSVSQRLREGYALPELITMPDEEILDLRVA